METIDIVFISRVNGDRVGNSEQENGTRLASQMQLDPGSRKCEGVRHEDERLPISLASVVCTQGNSNS